MRMTKQLLRKSAVILAVVLLLICAVPGVSAAEVEQASNQAVSVKVDSTSSYTLNTYTINGADYMKLRDLAMVLNGTAKQFSISCSSQDMSVVLTPGQPYQPVGGELKVPDTAATELRPNVWKVSVGSGTVLQSYCAGGNNYVSIADLAKALEFVALKDRAWNLSTYDEVNVVMPGVVKFGDFGTIDKTVELNVQCFDNLYFIGTTNVGCFVIETSEGLMMIDAMNGEEDFINIVEPAMRANGLDSADIEILLITHGHGDHVGFSKYVQDTYGAKVYLSEIDEQLAKDSYEAAVNGNGRTPVPVPRVDVYLTDGMTVTLGDETVTGIWTPGHTDGCFSFLVPVMDNGEEHLLCNWGGTGLNSDVRMMQDYVNSASKFAKVCREAGADIVLSMHPFCDYSLSRMELVEAARASGAANPMIQGEEVVQTFLYGVRQAAAGQLVLLGA